MFGMTKKSFVICTMMTNAADLMHLWTPQMGECIGIISTFSRWALKIRVPNSVSDQMRNMITVFPFSPLQLLCRIIARKLLLHSKKSR